MGLPPVSVFGGLGAGTTAFPYAAAGIAFELFHKRKVRVIAEVLALFARRIDPAQRIVRDVGVRVEFER